MKPRIVHDANGISWHLARGDDGGTVVTETTGKVRLISIPFEGISTFSDRALLVLASEPSPAGAIRGLVEAAEIVALEMVLANPSHQQAIDEHGTDGFTPLFFAVLKADPPYRLELVEVLIDSGANPYVMQDFPAVGFLHSSPYRYALDNQDSKLFAHLLYSRHVDVLRLHRFVISAEAQHDSEGKKLLAMGDVIAQYLEREKIEVPSSSERRILG